MDIRTVYAGQVPTDKDILLPQEFQRLAQGRLLDVLYGSDPSGAGFVVSTSSSAMQITVGSGILNVYAPVLPSNLGSSSSGLAANNTMSMKQFLMEQPQTLSIPQAGASYTVYAVCSDQDVDASVMPFVDANNPTQTQAGPGNSGTALPSRRAAQIQLVLASSAPSTPQGGVVIPITSLTVPQGATNTATTQFSVQPGIFWPSIPNLKRQIDQTNSALSAMQTTLQNEINAFENQTNGTISQFEGTVNNEFANLQTQVAQQIAAQNRGRFVRSVTLGGSTGGNSGTYQWAAGTNLIRVRAVGAGGAGGYAQGSNTQGAVSAGGAGAAGAYAEFTVPVSILPSGGVPWVTGAGGQPSTANSAGPGQATTFNGNAVVLNGGGGGYMGTATTTPSVSSSSYGGTFSLNADVSQYYFAVIFRGECGNSGMVFSGSNWPAIGASSVFGTGGTNANAGAGEGAQGPGAGGGGGGSGFGRTDFLGGAGGPGIIIVEEYT